MLIASTFDSLVRITLTLLPNLSLSLASLQEMGSTIRLRVLCAIEYKGQSCCQAESHVANAIPRLMLLLPVRFLTRVAGSRVMGDPFSVLGCFRTMTEFGTESSYQMRSYRTSSQKTLPVSVRSVPKKPANHRTIKTNKQIARTRTPMRIKKSRFQAGSEGKGNTRIASGSSLFGRLKR